MIGRTLNGKYKLMERIGVGGMAEVYRAIQLAPMQRTVAVKVLKSEYESDAAFIRRFDQEAEAVLVLSHENIVRSYDVGMDMGRHYIVLEYVEGMSLKERIQQEGPLSTKTIVNIGSQTLDALSHAHEMGIIHRDIKPQNIIVTPRGRAKLADFGIARQTYSESTQTFMGSNVLGSVQYLSPEQAKGERVTVRSDIYSMGVMLYEMATGRLPFEGESSVSIAVKHLSEEVVPPIVHNPNMPRALNDIILKALQKEARKRYPGARAMRQDLQRVLRDPNGTFAQPNIEDMPRKPRHKTGRGIMRITLAAFVLIGLFVILLLTGQSRMHNGTEQSAELVPTLTGKTVDEAKSIATRRGYTAEIIATVASEEVESGIVVTQYPLAGTSLKGGSTIEITVSGGSAETIAPDITTLTLSEAENALEEVGLVLGDVEHWLNEAPIGAIFRQDPAPGTTLMQGDNINVYISGEPSRMLEAPKVTELHLSDALKLLKEQGFFSFRVRYATPDENAAAKAKETGIVLLQNPVPGESFNSAGKFELVISGTALYAADLPFTLDVPEDQMQLLAVLAREINGTAYELVVYEALLQSGTQEISFTAAASEGGEHKVILYFNGTKVRETTAILSYRG